MKSPAFFLQFCALLVICCFCSGCKKSSNATSPVPKLSFKADGVSYTYTGEWNYSAFTGCSVDPLFISTLGYFIVTGVQQSNNNGFDANVFATSVEEKSYSNADFECFLNGVHYLNSSDEQLTITKIENGRASGFFSGKIAVSPTAAKVNITDGVFTDVKIR